MKTNPKTKPKTKAKISILSELLSYPTIRGKDWISDWKVVPQEGDLVSLHSCPDSKWYLSWVVEYNHNGGNPSYLLESIEDGDLCLWSNVGITIYDREKASQRPSWRWTDAQFSFKDKWHKVFKKHDAYIILPRKIVFNNDGSVDLDVRVRFNLNDFSNPKTFPDWKKLKLKDLEEYYLDSVDKESKYQQKLKEEKINDF